MNKTIYTIGRDPSSDICLYDENNLVSRYHAILKVKKNGTYVIIDQSLNGTYINGVRITQGREVPVTRKDMVMFANVAELDWTLIPKSNSWAKPALISVSAAIVIAAGVCAAIFIPSWERPSGNISGGGGAGTTIFYPSKDSLHRDSDDEAPKFRRFSPKTLKEKEKEKDIQKKETEKVDSIKNVDTPLKGQEDTGVATSQENMEKAPAKSENPGTNEDVTIDAIY